MSRVTFTASALGTSLLLLAGCQGASRQTVTDARSANGLAHDLAGHGPHVVLVHGSNLDRRMWNAEMAWLRERARVLRYDLGGSDHGDLVALLDELEIETISLVGLSSGAQIALDVALEARP